MRFQRRIYIFYRKLKDCGQQCTEGWHFDEEKYEKREINVPDAIEKELDILESFLGGDSRVISVSMHRPSQKTLDSNYVIRSGNVINSYGEQSSLKISRIYPIPEEIGGGKMF